MSPDNSAAQSEEDRMAAEWAAALAESKPAEAATTTAVEQVAPASFANFNSATPQLTCSRSSSPGAISHGLAAMAFTMRSITILSARLRCRPTTNSSPPQRATQSPRRVFSCSSAATCEMHASPALCPWRSFTPRKPWMSK